MTSSALTPTALYAPPIAPCVADRSTPPPFFDHAADLFKHAKEAAKEFANAGLVASGGSTRAKDGGRAMRMLRRMRDKFPDPKVNKQELQHMLALSMMCGWRRSALKYARELLDEDACRDDDGCYCATAGHIVSLLRQTQKSFVAAETFFEKRVARAQRCTFTSSWQMPVPFTGYAPWLGARPFWDPLEFATGRLLRDRADDVLAELAPFSSRRHGLWRTPDEHGRTPDQDPELVESGWWRQLSLFSERTGWNSTICAQIPLTCELLADLNRTADGAREIGGKVKLFELGPRSALMPHFGPTNTRLLLHFAVSLPASTCAADGSTDDDAAARDGRSAYVRVGKETRAWRRAGDIVVFDDSFEHDARNDGDAPRMVLAVQLLHPDLGEGTLVDGRWVYSTPEIDHGEPTLVPTGARRRRPKANEIEVGL